MIKNILIEGKPDGTGQNLVDRNATRELSQYINYSFGDPTRIDYGSGHELNFLCFLLCL